MARSFTGNWNAGNFNVQSSYEVFYFSSHKFVLVVNYFSILQSPIFHMMLTLPLSHDWWVKEGPPDELFSPRKEVRTKLERYIYNSSSQFIANFPQILQHHSICTWYLASFPGSWLAFHHSYCKWWKKGGQENGSYTANKLNATTNKHSVSMQLMSSMAGSQQPWTYILGKDVYCH